MILSLLKRCRTHWKHGTMLSRPIIITITVCRLGHRIFSMRAPDFPERVVLDVELLDNLYIRNADYGVVALNTNYLLE